MMENTASTTQSTTGAGYHRPVTGAERGRNASAEEFQPSQDIVQYLKDYARARPDVAALWCFGIGFVIGWKLKPW